MNFVLPLTAIDPTNPGALATVGGKALGLADLITAGMPVPPGFCVTTSAYRHALEDAGAAAQANHTVAGGYRVRLTLTDRRVAVSVTLVQGGLPVFVATFTGTPSRATARTVVRAELRTPLASRQTVTRIRWHGIRLWRRLPVVPRRPHTPPRGLE